MAFQSATNQETGEKVYFVNGQWEPLQTATNPQTGQKSFFVNNQWTVEGDVEPAQDGTTVQQAISGINERAGVGTQRAFSIGEQGQATEVPVTPEIEEKPPLFQGIGESIIPQPMTSTRGIKTSLDVGATIGPAAVGEPVAGVAGLAQLASGKSAEEAAQTIENVQQKFTRQPTTEGGQQALENIGRVVEKLPDVSKISGDFAMELTGSPVVAAAVSAAPTLIAELIGIRGLKALRPGTRLLDTAGRPTKQLRIALDKQGLDFDTLKDSAKAEIPEIIEAEFFETPTIKSKVETALIEQIKAGGKDDALAGLKVEGNRVRPDKTANEAIKQGFRAGLVQSVKTANPATKEKMLKMSNMMQRIQKQEGLGLKFRPSDVIGNSVTDRIKFIRGKADVARVELDSIAREKLRGQSIETGGVTNTLEKSLSDLDVSLTEPRGGGKPKPVFKNSLISKDRSAQRAITDVIDLMAEGGQPDALRLHKLKRQLDNMIDFKKKSPIGLTDAGKKVLKKVRASLNESLRATNPDYADVNDILSESLTSLDDLDNAVGTIDIFGKGSNKAIGQKMRALLSNQQGRIKLENALDGVEDTVTSLGGKFDDNVGDLVMFSDALNNRFGTTAKTSFAGQITQGVEEGARRIPSLATKAGIAAGGAKLAGKGLEKLRGVNDFKAFESLNNLLARQK